jgi:choline kinase
MTNYVFQIFTTACRNRCANIFFSLAVSIAEPIESISPMMRGSSKNVDEFQLDRQSSKQRRAKMSSRLTGRPSTERLVSSRHGSMDFFADLGYESTASTRPNSINDHDGFLSRVSTWLHQEKARREASKARRKAAKSSSDQLNVDLTDGAGTNNRRRDSDSSSDGSAALEKLQEILAQTMSLSDRRPSRSKRASVSSKYRRLSTAASSDTEYLEGDALVPGCEAILDNSKTLSYSGGGIDGETESGQRPLLSRASSSVQKDAWKTFKYEIVRLTHTLRLKGWRKVSMELSSQIDVERLSGALTNAVYVVSPPKDLPSKSAHKGDDAPIPQKPPP